MTEYHYIYNVYNTVTNTSLENFETEKDAIEYSCKCGMPTKVRVLRVIKNGNKGVSFERVDVPNKLS